MPTASSSESSRRFVRSLDPQYESQTAKDLREPVIANASDAIRKSRSVNGAQLRYVHHARLGKTGLSLAEPDMADGRTRFRKV
jgi:hypothetical protein